MNKFSDDLNPPSSPNSLTLGSISIALDIIDFMKRYSLLTHTKYVFFSSETEVFVQAGALISAAVLPSMTLVLGAGMLPSVALYQVAF